MVVNNTITFRPRDVPDLPELELKDEPKEKHETPPPKDWRPIGAEW